MRTLVFFAVFLCLAFVGVIVGLNVASINADPSQAEKYRALATQISILGTNAWSFSAPLLQLTIVLLILEWFAKRVGIGLNFSSLGTSPNIQIFIALIVICAYCIAVLGGIPSEGLKELALIVVGFYFGSKIAEARSRQADLPTPSQQGLDPKS